ncbi:CLUMA_CG001981, isoform A [Clunio marinus]|uniref:CLUMA_CG001981, isoform A n=1 Tax=Clunio marinus TaxID=568069 RepID=A0A1J1HJG8_9DIPT|nr:CLUMA_CG001981, isoform A [Clunio marinus]
MHSAVKYLSQCATIFQLFGHQYFSVKNLSDENLNRQPTIGYKIYFTLLFSLLVILSTIMVALLSADYKVDKITAKVIFSAAVTHSMLACLILIIVMSFVQSFTTTSKLINYHIEVLITLMSQTDKNLIQVSIINKKSLNPRLKLYGKINYLKTIYDILYENSMLVNECFGTTILVVIINMINNFIACINNFECDRYQEIDYITNELLKRFYLQLIYQPIRFTTGGFYTINLGLLTSALYHI